MADLEEQKRYQELDRAEKAKAVLDNPMVKVALDDIEQEVLRMMENTHDDQLILKLHRMYVCSRKFRNTLVSHIETGKLAALQLEQKRKLKLWSSN